MWQIPVRLTLLVSTMLLPASSQSAPPENPSPLSGQAPVEDQDPGTTPAGDPSPVPSKYSPSATSEHRTPASSKSAPPEDRRPLPGQAPIEDRDPAMAPEEAIPLPVFGAESPSEMPEHRTPAIIVCNCPDSDPPSVARLHDVSPPIPDAFHCLHAPSAVGACPLSPTAMPDTRGLLPDGAGSAGSDAPHGVQNGEAAPPPRENRQGSESDPLTGVFAGPAHFCAAGVARPGGPASVIIYEGMHIRACRNGTYEVSMLVECPNLPTTLRFQLRVLKHDVAVGTITLAPVRLPGTAGGDATIRLLSEHDTTRIWRIHRSGYSWALHRALTAPASHACPRCSRTAVAIERTGTVRIGQIPDRSTSY